MQPERLAQTTLAFHASRIVIDVGVLMAMASMSMAFIVADSGNRSAIDADALPVVLLLLPIFVVTLIPDHTGPLHPVAAWFALALGLAALPYAAVKMLDAGTLANTLDGSLGFGSRLMVIGCGVTVVGIAIGLFRNLFGLPTGGTPRRSRLLRRPPEPAEVSGDSPRSEKPSPPDSAKAADVAPTRLLPIQSEPDPSVTSDSEAVDTPSSQPEIVFPDTGAVAREAAPDSTPENGLFDTAELADAALDEHLASMTDPDDQPADE